MSFGLTSNCDWDLFYIEPHARPQSLPSTEWLSRRSHTGQVDWAHLLVLLERFPLPRPRIVHRYNT